jgi:Zn-dependent peptidase ImmA (M78 family)/transcriptional regulator with XRE-family HTH domain
VFTPARLTLARERRGLTKKQVAEQISVSTRAMTSFEAGEVTPAPLTIARLADVLRFPASFFDAQELEQIPTEAASFRSLSKMSAANRHAALAAGSFALALHDWVSDRFRLPEPAVPKLGPGVDPETAAHIVRAEWNLGEKPISNVVHLLEARGVRVFSLTQECHEVDAFSLWRSSQPFIFLNTQKSGEHSRFDAAHELGHLVLHWHHEAPQGKQPEAEANRFAAAFLMPAASLTASAPRLPNLQDLIRGKRRWKVSVAAYTHRLHELKLLTAWQYRTLFVDISQRGYRINEPNGIQRETSQILNKVFTTLRREGIGKGDIARALDLYQEDLDALVFGLAMLPVAGNGGIRQVAQFERRPAHTQLHLVTNSD